MLAAVVFAPGPLKSRSRSVASQRGQMTMAGEQEKLAVLKRRADNLGYQIEPSVKKLGYCLRGIG